MNWLRSLDAQLTEIEFSSEMSPEHKKEALQRLRKEAMDRKERLDKVS